MLEQKRVLAIIPARGGSKGILGKNLKKVGDLSLVARAVKLARSIDWIDRVMISTDDAAIAKEAIAFGASFFGFRPAKLATDQAIGIDVWAHALRTTEQKTNEVFDISLYLQPTSPFRTTEHLKQTITPLLESDRTTSVITVSRIPGSYHPNKLLKISETGKIKKYTSGHLEQSNRQDNGELFVSNGICYAAKRTQILRGKKIFSDESAAVLIDDHEINIDCTFDLLLAQLYSEKTNFG